MSAGSRTRQDTDPLTATQLGAVHGEFERLGAGSGDRHNRLIISALLAEYPGELESTKDLTMGQAGRLIGALRGCGTAADLVALIEPPAPRPVITCRSILAALLGISNRVPTKNGE